MGWDLASESMRSAIPTASLRKWLAAPVAIAAYRLTRALVPLGIGALGVDARRKGGGLGPFFGLHPSSANG